MTAALIALGAACSKTQPEGTGPNTTASAAAATSASVAFATASASATEPAASASGSTGTAPPTSGIALVEAATLAKLTFEKGMWVAELERTPPARAWLTLATKEAPLAPRSRAAHFRIAERVAPGVVAPTALRALSVAELSRVADAPTRKRLEKQARVLANGTVEVALTLAPSPALTRVEVRDIGEESPVRAWETRLGAREPVPGAERLGLAQYQALLVIDYVSDNGARVTVFRHDRSGRITAAEGNEAFSAVPKEGAQNDALTRFSRHMTYSKSLAERLDKLERADLESALGWGQPPTLLVTPKQIDECVDRLRSVRRLMAERTKQRGKDLALGLP